MAPENTASAKDKVHQKEKQMGVNDTETHPNDVHFGLLLAGVLILIGVIAGLILVNM